MKKNFYWMFLALFGAMVLVTSCSDDDDDIRASEVPNAVRETLQVKFPNVTGAEWEKKWDYYVADFWQEGIETHVWINSAADWKMTEYDLGTGVMNLPQSVQNAFQSSQYATWRVDDIDKYERTDKTFYLIEVETGGQRDRDLYYGEDGTLLKDETDTGNNDVTPDTVL